MKIRNLLFVSLGILFAVGIFFSCQEDENNKPDKKGEAVFSFNSINTKDKAVKESASIDDAAVIIISVRNADGDMVYDLEQLPLIKINDSFITKPISLLLGDYELTQFIVADAQGTALYIAPIEGSNNAYLVDVPLPIQFTIAKDEVAKIIPEVVSADFGTPEDFGYSTFSFTVVETFNFLVSVFVYDSQIENFALTTANLTVTSEGVTLYSNDLQAITNDITIRDGYDNYILTVAKDGYQSYIDTIANEQLKLYYSSDDNGPLVVTLDEADCGCPSTVIDVEGNVYATVQIGDQCWMAENLKTTKYNDGSVVPLVTDNTVWASLITPGYCWYNNDEATYKDTYGALYNWYAVGTGKLAPTGWHIPTSDEWKLLSDNFGGANIAGSFLKESGTTHWYLYYPGTLGNNESGFTALPGGIRVNTSGIFYSIGQEGRWWTSTMDYAPLAKYYSLQYNDTYCLRADDTRANGFSIRCVKD